MAKFKEGQYVACVYQKRFIEDLKNGKFVIAKIYKVRPSEVGCKDNFIYQAKDEDGSIYIAYEKYISNGLYEFIEIESLVKYLNTYGQEKIGDGVYLIDKAKDLASKYC